MYCDCWMEYLKYSAILQKKNALSTGTGVLVYHFDIHLPFFYLILDNPQDIPVFLEPLIKRNKVKIWMESFFLTTFLTSLFINAWFSFVQNSNSTFIWHNWVVHNLGISEWGQYISDKQKNSCY